MIIFDFFLLIETPFIGSLLKKDQAGSGVLALVWQGRPIVNLAPPVCYSWEFTRNINIQLSII